VPSLPSAVTTVVRGDFLTSHEHAVASRLLASTQTLEVIDMSMLDAARSLLTPDVITRVSGKTGESDAAVTKGFGAAIPMLLASLAGRSNDHGFMTQFASLASRTADVDTSTPQGAWAHVASADSMTTAQTGLRSLFGDGLPNVVSGLSSYSGVKSSSSSTMLATAVPLLLHFFGRMMRTEHLDAAGLGDRLRSERRSFEAAVPSQFGSLIPGLGHSAETIKARTSPGRSVYRSTARTQEPTRWLVPVIVAGLALTGLFWWWGHQRPTREARNAGDLSTRAVGTAGAVTDHLTRRLPNNMSIDVPKGGMEDQLVSYLGTSSATRPQQSFDFDRIGFDRGAALTTESREQIGNVASILKAYPEARVTLAGGPQAETVANSLRDMGVAADRMQVRGNGSQNPIAGNESAAGRANNGRVTLTVNK
jgi:outer membrane protein OmpA-like peptidoglycan-associated protein